MFYLFRNNKVFNTTNYTTYIWSYKIEYDYFMTEQIVEAFRRLCFPQHDTKFYYQVAKTSQYWHHFMIMEFVSDLT